MRIPRSEAWRASPQERTASSPLTRGDAATNGSTSATLLQVNATGSINVALASNGGGWNDTTLNSFPDWVQINFDGAKIIDHVVVDSVQDNYLSPVEPTYTMTFSLCGLVDVHGPGLGWNQQGDAGDGQWQ